MKQGPGNTIDDVALKMEELFAYLNNQSESYQVRTFLSAIDPKVAYQIEKEATPTSFSEAKNKAKQIEKSKNKYKYSQDCGVVDVSRIASSTGARSMNSSVIGDRSDVDSIFGTRSEVSSLVAKLEQLSINLVKLNENQKQNNFKYSPAAGNNSSYGRVFTCFFCNEPGHKKYECHELK